MEHADDPATGRAFHSVDLSLLPLDSLALLTQEGDERAAMVLWRRCDAIARPIAWSRGATADHQWRDVLSEAVLRALQGFRPSRGRFKPYFAKVFTHALIDEQVRQAKVASRRSALTDDTDELPSYHAWLTDDGERAEYESSLLARASAATVAEFESSAHRRREHQRWATIARLHLLDKLPAADIAECLGISRKDVHNCLGRHVLSALRRHADRIRLADSGDTENCP
jgi:DNA-directed RNA polymerase specialized sigma24 family protein